MACLLLSHLAWTHTGNQRLFAEAAVIERLLSLIKDGLRFAAGATSSDVAGGLTFRRCGTNDFLKPSHTNILEPRQQAVVHRALPQLALLMMLVDPEALLGD